MKDQETGIIEGSITTEENFPQGELKNTPKTKTSKIPKISPAKILQKLRQKITYLKRPKFATIVILFLSIIAIYVGLVVFLAKQPKENIDRSIVIPSSTPQTNAKDLPAEITNKKDAYYKDLEILDSDLKNSAFPQVDLNITF